MWRSRTVRRWLAALSYGTDNGLSHLSTTGHSLESWGREVPTSHPVDARSAQTHWPARSRPERLQRVNRRTRTHCRKFESPVRSLVASAQSPKQGRHPFQLATPADNRVLSIAAALAVGRQRWPPSTRPWPPAKLRRSVDAGALRTTVHRRRDRVSWVGDRALRGRWQQLDWCCATWLHFRHRETEHIAEKFGAGAPVDGRRNAVYLEGICQAFSPSL